MPSHLDWAAAAAAAKGRPRRMSLSLVNEMDDDFHYRWQDSDRIKIKKVLEENRHVYSSGHCRRSNLRKDRFPETKSSPLSSTPPMIKKIAGKTVTPLPKVGLTIRIYQALNQTPGAPTRRNISKSRILSKKSQNLVHQNKAKFNQQTVQHSSRPKSRNATALTRCSFATILTDKPSSDELATQAKDLRLSSGKSCTRLGSRLRTKPRPRAPTGKTADTPYVTRYTRSELHPREQTSNEGSCILSPASGQTASQTAFNKSPNPCLTGIRKSNSNSNTAPLENCGSKPETPGSATSRSRSPWTLEQGKVYFGHDCSYKSDDDRSWSSQPPPPPTSPCCFSDYEDFSECSNWSLFHETNEDSDFSSLPPDWVTPSRCGLFDLQTAFEEMLRDHKPTAEQSLSSASMSPCCYSSFCSVGKLEIHNCQKTTLTPHEANGLQLAQNPSVSSDHSVLPSTENIFSSPTIEHERNSEEYVDELCTNDSPIGMDSQVRSDTPFVTESCLPPQASFSFDSLKEEEEETVAPIENIHSKNGYDNTCGDETITKPEDCSVDNLNLTPRIEFSNETLFCDLTSPETIQSVHAALSHVAVPAPSSPIVLAPLPGRYPSRTVPVSWDVAVRAMEESNPTVKPLRKTRPGSPGPGSFQHSENKKEPPTLQEQPECFENHQVLNDIRKDKTLSRGLGLRQVVGDAEMRQMCEQDTTNKSNSVMNLDSGIRGLGEGQTFEMEREVTEQMEKDTMSFIDSCDKCASLVSSSKSSQIANIESKFSFLDTRGVVFAVSLFLPTVLTLGALFFQIACDPFGSNDCNR